MTTSTATKKKYAILYYILCQVIRSWFAVHAYVCVCVCANEQHMVLATQILNSFLFLYFFFMCALFTALAFMSMVAAVVVCVNTERSTHPIHECLLARLCVCVCVCAHIEF